MAHYGAITMPEYLAVDRRGADGPLRPRRGVAQHSDVRHARRDPARPDPDVLPLRLLDKEPRGDWAHKAYHTNEWIVIAARYLFDDMFIANDAGSMAMQLTFTFETGFTNLQFLGMAADAMTGRRPGIRRADLVHPDRRGPPRPAG